MTAKHSPRRRLRFFTVDDLGAELALPRYGVLYNRTDGALVQTITLRLAGETAQASEAMHLDFARPAMETPPQFVPWRLCAEAASCRPATVGGAEPRAHARGGILAEGFRVRQATSSDPQCVVPPRGPPRQEHAMKTIPVILCGGSGTRLWPLPRRDFSTQRVPILGGETPFQRTLRRLNVGAGFERAIVITGAAGRFITADQASETGLPVEVVVEPEAQDTLPAVAELIACRDAEAIAMIVHSDHLVPDPAASAAAVHHAAEAAGDGAIVTFGVTPTGPATAYGYIWRGAPVGHGAWRIAAFEEKPDADRAASLIAEGCLWNAGMFCFREGGAQRLIAALAPEAAAAAAADEATDDLGSLRLGPAFSTASRLSFDYVVMETTNNALVVEANFEWSDIGDWCELWRHSDTDAAGNATEGDVTVVAAATTTFAPMVVCSTRSASMGSR